MHKMAFIFDYRRATKRREFLDFDKKYLDFSRTKRVNEANLPLEVQEALKVAFAKLYDPLLEVL